MHDHKHPTVILKPSRVRLFTDRPGGHPFMLACRTIGRREISASSPPSPGNAF
jgi:hypothetical protein